MRQVTGSMTNVVRGMDQAMKAMDLEKVHRSYLGTQRTRLMTVQDFGSNGPF